jgi:predicted dienelactone hydrolase
MAIKPFNLLGQNFYHFAFNQERPVEIVLWYPSQEGNPICQETVWKEPHVVVEGIIQEGKHPLIVFSHGWEGEKREQMWLAKKLVEQGYIVAAVDHFGNTWKNPSPNYPWEQRPADISSAVDYLMENPSLQSYIDPERIGFVGFSMGGLTGIWLAGGEIEVKSFKDPRFKAYFLMAPRGAEFDAESLKRVTAPIFIVSGKEDKILPLEKQGNFLSKHLKNHTFIILEGHEGHFVFMNTPTPLGKRELPPAIVEDHPSVNRDQVHEHVAEMAIRFFQKELHS